MPRSFTLLLALLLVPATLRAQTRVELQGFLGSAASLPSRISVTQAGQPDLHVTAHWDTRPWKDTWYYAGRLGFWRGHRGWLLDFTHHKIYQNNPTPEIELFRITNGMNLFTVSRGFEKGHLAWQFGAGPVVTFPISRVRDRKLEAGRGFMGGYFLSGGHVMAAVTRRLHVAAGLFLSLDGRASFSYVRVPVYMGHASVPNFALHFHVGMGYLTGMDAQASGEAGR
jgi:hypothetical protein